jgi:hypothetical protein
MKRNLVWLGFVLGLLVFAGCRSTPIAPAVSQTVVSVHRHSSSGTGQMDIFVDGRQVQTIASRPKDIRLRSGQSTSFPVNNGVHTIYVQIGNSQSETINFTADGTTLAFVATSEGIGPLRKVTLSRSVVDDDTGSLTGRRIQESF